MMPVTSLGPPEGLGRGILIINILAGGMQCYIPAQFVLAAWGPLLYQRRNGRTSCRQPIGYRRSRAAPVASQGGLIGGTFGSQLLHFQPQVAYRTFRRARSFALGKAPGSG